MSRGRRLLIAVLQRTTETDVAARCRASQPIVSQWASGVRSPCLESRLCLERNYGIPREAWDMPFMHSVRPALHCPKLR